MDDNLYSSNTAHYKTMYNAYFRGCTPALGCTICLSGPNEDELNDVKNCIEIILNTCREELLGNGFEKRDFSIAIKNKAKGQHKSLRHKTFFAMKPIQNKAVNLTSNDVERGGFLDTSI